MRDEAPDFDVPPYKGERYEALPLVRIIIEDDQGHRAWSNNILGRL